MNPTNSSDEATSEEARTKLKQDLNRSPVLLGGVFWFRFQTQYRIFWVEQKKMVTHHSLTKALMEVADMILVPTQGSKDTCATTACAREKMFEAFGIGGHRTSRSARFICLRTNFSEPINVTKSNHDVLCMCTSPKAIVFTFSHQLLLNTWISTKSIPRAIINNKSILRIPKKGENLIELPCPYEGCNVPFQREGQLAKHMEMKHGIANFRLTVVKCPFLDCNKECKNIQGAKLHITRVHYKCPTSSRALPAPQVETTAENTMDTTLVETTGGSTIVDPLELDLAEIEIPMMIEPICNETIVSTSNHEQQSMEHHSFTLSHDHGYTQSQEIENQLPIPITESCLMETNQSEIGDIDQNPIELNQMEICDIPLPPGPPPAFNIRNFNTPSSQSSSPDKTQNDTHRPDEYSEEQELMSSYTSKFDSLNVISESINILLEDFDYTANIETVFNPYDLYATYTSSDIPFISPPDMCQYDLMFTPDSVNNPHSSNLHNPTNNLTQLFNNIITATDRTEKTMKTINGNTMLNRNLHFLNTLQMEGANEAINNFHNEMRRKFPRTHSREGCDFSTEKFNTIFKNRGPKAAFEFLKESGLPNISEFKPSFESLIELFPPTHSTDLLGIATELEKLPKAWNTFDMSLFTIDETLTALKEMKESNYGHDGYTALEWKKVDPEAIFLTGLVNFCLQTLSVPSQLLSADLIFIPKKITPQSIKDYRPISLQAVPYKILTKLLNNRMVHWFSEHELISPLQMGFVPCENKQSPTHEASFINKIITISTLLGNKDCTACWLDLSNAFNSIPHDLMFEILYKMNIGPPFLKLLKFIYENTWLHSVPHERAFRLSRGVNQGDPLSSSIFILCFEIILRSLPQDQFTLYGLNIPFLAYADDLVPYCTTPEQMQATLDNLQQLTSKLGMKINPVKSISLTISEGKFIQHIYHLDNQLITPSQGPYTVKYMGVNTNFTDDRLSSPIMVIKSITRDLTILASYNITFFQCLTIINRVILARLPYFSRELPTYSITLLSQIDRLIRTLVRKTLHLPTTFPSAVMYLPTKQGGLGIPSFLIMVIRDGAIFPLRLLDSPNKFTNTLAKCSLLDYINLPVKRKQRTPTIWKRFYASIDFITKKMNIGLAWKSINSSSTHPWLLATTDTPTGYLTLTHKNFGSFLSRRYDRVLKISSLRQYTQRWLMEVKHSGLSMPFISEELGLSISQVSTILQLRTGSGLLRYFFQTRSNRTNHRVNNEEEHSDTPWNWCRICHNEIESLSHVFRNHPPPKETVSKLHDNIKEYLHKQITKYSNLVKKQEFHVFKETKLVIETEKITCRRINKKIIPCFNTIRPDIHLINYRTGKIIFVEIHTATLHMSSNSSRGYSTFEDKQKMKAARYDEVTKELVNCGLNNKSGWNVTTLPIVIGNLAVWPRSNSKFLKKLGFGHKPQKWIAKHIIKLTIQQMHKILYYLHNPSRENWKFDHLMKRNIRTWNTTPTALPDPSSWDVTDEVYKDLTQDD